ncbi:MAG: hypothetical protein VXX56_07510 [Pseudomonadota bacterium]|nr:hypothetical protein [Pseudomonadota bacterium]MEC9228212.1 hypothetical protein [Verrucomicrobiota bacterium]
MQKRLFDRDPELGITKYWHVKDNGEYVVETVQDVTGIAEYNKRSYNNTDKKWKDVNKVASIPLSVYYELKRQGIADDPKALRKWLNDSNNQVFRTRQGVL